jgi:hypothetical protein
LRILYLIERSFLISSEFNCQLDIVLRLLNFFNRTTLPNFGNTGNSLILVEEDNMKMRLFVELVAGSFLFGFIGITNATIIGGVDFPNGEVSFADSVYAYSPGPDVGTGYDDPNAALGIPDYSGADNTAVSLGDGGFLTLQFTDNSLTTSGDDALDLWIFEVGAVTEWMNVAISTNAIDWIGLGDVLGQPTGIDIDGISGVTLGTRYSYVRISDILPNQTNSPFGEADIDAVGAISSAPPIVPVPEPSTMLLFGAGLAGIVGSRIRKKKKGSSRNRVGENSTNTACCV